MISGAVKYLLVTIMIISAMFSGCAKNESQTKYLDAARQFNKIYFETVEHVDLTNTMESFKVLMTEDNKKNIKKLGSLLPVIKENIPADREKLYDNFKQRYKDLVFLNESYPNLSNLDQEGRGRIDLIFISIGMNKSNWEDKSSTMVWE